MKKLLVFGLVNSRRGQKTLKNKEEECELSARLRASQFFLKNMKRKLNLGDLANLRNPFIEV